MAAATRGGDRGGGLGVVTRTGARRVAWARLASLRRRAAAGWGEGLAAAWAECLLRLGRRCAA